uniref:hypothetical protein n=1 Tax=Limnohabitans sp. TaxID=1907725 RepID=UPI004047C2E0
GAGAQRRFALPHRPGPAPRSLTWAFPAGLQHPGPPPSAVFDAGVKTGKSNPPSPEQGGTAALVGRCGKAKRL